MASATVVAGSVACSSEVQQAATPQHAPVAASEEPGSSVVEGLTARTTAECIPSATAWWA
ncbi:hypothetical protein ACIBW9_14510 [Streptomyces sp. NPDC049541]|uniref:hypothetical protein n=1 Tax=Streptomyces sp. NPDC049541 TaxID=3365594 RepID=UPI00379A8919